MQYTFGVRAGRNLLILCIRRDNTWIAFIFPIGIFAPDCIKLHRSNFLSNHLLRVILENPLLTNYYAGQYTNPNLYDSNFRKCSPSEVEICPTQITIFIFFFFVEN